MKRWLNGFTLLATVGVVFLLLVLISAEPNILRTMLVAPVVLLLVLLLPGFALTHILFERERMGLPERLLLSIGLSVSLIALTGLVLNWTRLGLKTTTLWAALLLGLAVTAVVVLFVRRLKWTDIVSLPGNLNFTARQWIFVSLAALVTIVAFNIARTPVAQQGFEGYTTLWILPGDVPDRLRLGVRSDEFANTKYEIRFELNGIVHQGPTFELKPGEAWEDVVHFPSGQLAGQPFTVSLYRLDQPNEVYRHAVWWPETK